MSRECADFAAGHLGLVFLLGELLLPFSGDNVWGVLGLLSSLLLSLKLDSSVGKMLLEVARKLGRSVLGELLGLPLGEDGLELRVHGSLAFALVLRFAEIVKTVVQLLLGGGNGGIFLLVGVELGGAVKFLGSVLRLAVSRRFTKLVDVIESRVKGERAVDEIVGIALVIVIVACFSEGVTTLLTLFAAANDEHGDDAGDEEDHEEADEGACNGCVEGIVVLGGFGDVRHDE